MFSDNQKVLKITAAGLVNVVDVSCFLQAIVASIVTAGTLTITIQDRSSAPGPYKLVPPFDLTPPGSGTGILVRSWAAPRLVRMNYGIDVVTTGTGGELYLWIWYTMQPDAT